MIHNFSAKNFYSIDEKIDVNLVAKEKGITRTELYADSALGKKVTKLAFIGGANGSGKSNIMRVLAFTKYLVGSGEDTDDDIPFVQFVPNFRKKPQIPTEISVDFSIDNSRIYTLKFSLIPERILEEELTVSEFISERSSSRRIYLRKWNKESSAYKLILSDEASILKSISELPRILSTGKNQRKTVICLFSDIDSVESILRKIKEFWQNVQTNIVAFGSVEAEGSASTLAGAALKEMVEKTSCSNLCDEMMKKIDIGFSKIEEAKTEDDDHQKFYVIRHKFGGYSFRLAPFQESTGTNRISYLISRISKALSVENGVAIVDDFDAFVHPDVYEKLISYFTSLEKNIKGTQLIFSSHNYTTLNLLDKQQIILVERNEMGATETFRLDEVNGVRADDNFYAKYMAGVYGGTPRIS